MNSASRRKTRWRYYRCCAKVGLLMFVAFSIVLSITLLIVLARTLFLQHRLQSSLGGLFGAVSRDMVDESRCDQRAARLAGALRIPTVSFKTDHQNEEALVQFHEYLRQSFPILHSHPAVKREIVNSYSLLYSVDGTKSDALPYLLASHLDVVPANDNRAWEVPPFSGTIVNDSYIYGRGAIDDKCGVLGILEALEYFLEQGHRPYRTFYIAFGHDEEVSGKRGAQELAKLLRSRGVEQLDFVLDEGFPVSQDLIPGTNKPVAMVGVSEKGSATIELSVSGTPGHSSFPPCESAIGILSAALSRLEQYPQPSMFGQGPERHMFEYLAPHVSFLYKVIYSNMWLFSWLMVQKMEAKPITNAFVRTTTAITMFQGGIKENVIPPSATAVVNLRIHPAQTVAEVLDYMRGVLADPRIRVSVKRSREAHPVSPHRKSCLPFQLIVASIRQVFSQAIVVPAVFIANTDTRWYLNFTSNLYRFLPTVVGQDDVSRYHGYNERISVKHYHQAVSFYYRIIKNADIILSISPTSHTGFNDEEL